MFNSKFNISKFNTGRTVPAMEVAAFFAERLEGLIGIGTDMPAGHVFHLAASGRVMLAGGLLCGLEQEAALDQNTRLRADVPVMVMFPENMAARTALHMDIYLSPVFADALLSKVLSGKDIYFGQEFTDALSQKAAACADFNLAHTFFEVFSCVIYAVVLDYQTFNLPVTIPPGGELRIDSKYFTAMLNAQNALHLYNGDWIELRPGTVRLDLSGAGGAGLTAQVLYNERYL